MKHFLLQNFPSFIFWALLIFMSGCTPVSRAYSITEKDNGKTFSFRITSRFGINLDENKHSFENLDYDDCTIIGRLSNWSVQGPNNYPIGFQVVEKGICFIRNGDFEVQIIGIGGS